MEPNRPKTAREEALEAARANKPPDTSAADRQQVVDNALWLTGELSGDIDSGADSDTPLQPELEGVRDLLPEAVAGQTPVGPEVAGDESSTLDADVAVNPFVAEALAIARAEGREPGVPASAASAALAAKASDRPGPRLQPPLFRLDVMGAAHAAATVQSGARRPEIQKLMADAPASSTLPLLDADGGFPRDTQAMLRALLLWEAAAAEAVGDPLFTPKPTTKPRNELASIDRGGLFQTVWMDQATRQPVLYSGPDEHKTKITQPWRKPPVAERQTARPEIPWAERTGADPSADAPLTSSAAASPPPSPPKSPNPESASRAPNDRGGSLGMTWPVLKVQLAEPEKSFEAELDAFAERMRAYAKREADQSVYDYHRWWETEERAIWGP